MLATVSINQVGGDKAIQEQLILYKSTVFLKHVKIYHPIPLLNSFMQRNNLLENPVFKKILELFRS